MAGMGTRSTGPCEPHIGVGFPPKRDMRPPAHMIITFFLETVSCKLATNLAKDDYSPTRELRLQA